MTNDKLMRTFQMYADRFASMFNSSTGPQRARTDTVGIEFWDTYRHAWWMCLEAQTYITSGRAEKAMRWLGFVQGVLWARSIYSIDELAEHNKPDEVPFCRACHGNKKIPALDIDNKTSIMIECPLCINPPAVSP